MFVNGGGGRATKPPGGESHDLFGAEFKGTPCHHRVLKPPGGGTSDIFGAPEPLQNSPRRAHNKMQSSVFGPTNSDANLQARSKPDGNPVTGEGYTNGDKQPPASASTTPTTNGTNGTNSANSSHGTHSAPPQRQRVPPGGYSSGLW